MVRYPFVASWSLRGAMACGCALVVSDTAPVSEFVRHDDTGLLVPFHDPVMLAEASFALLDRPSKRARLGCATRHFAEEHLGLERVMRRSTG